MIGLLGEVRDISDATRTLAKTVSTAHDAYEGGNETVPVCNISVEWLNMVMNRWALDGYPILGIVLRSPAVALVTTPAGQQAGFLDDGTAVTAVPVLWPSCKTGQDHPGSRVRQAEIRIKGLTAGRSTSPWRSDDPARQRA